MKKILYSPGEPSGIGPDLIIQMCASTLWSKIKTPIVCLSDPKLIEDRAKSLSKKKREYLCNYIKKNSIWSTGKASVKEIENLNILQASLLAMKRAIKKLKKKPTNVLIDGNKIPELENYNLKSVIQGDKKVPSISAASIIAKVSRDKFVTTLSKKK